MPDDFAILGIDDKAPLEAVRRAFRSLARKYHPEGGSEPNAEKFKEISEAYKNILEGRAHTGNAWEDAQAMAQKRQEHWAKVTREHERHRRWNQAIIFGIAAGVYGGGTAIIYILTGKKHKHKKPRRKSKRYN